MGEQLARRIAGAVAGANAVLLAVAGLLLTSGGLSSDGQSRDWLAAVAFTAIGARVASRRRRNPVGWLLLAAGTSAALAVVSAAAASTSPVLAWLAQWVWWPGYALVPIALLLFPDGRLAGRRWRYAGAAAVAGLVLPSVGLAVALRSAPDVLVAIDAPVPPEARAGLLAAAVGMLAAAAAALAAVIGLAQRRRRSTGRERRQLNWILAAALAVAVSGVLESVGIPGVWLLSAVAMPVAAAVAIVRHGLYDLDALVSRTIAYATLTLLLAGLYVVVVVIGQVVFRPFTTGSQLAVAASTLAVAAVFRPARRRIQHAVDRRFSRSRYDAVLAVEAFAARMREQTDQERLTAELVAVVTATLAPAHCSLWLAEAPLTQARPPTLERQAA